MPFRRLLRPLAFLIISAIIGRDGVVAATHAWQRWEHTLTSSVIHDNPYADVTLRVRYAGPGGRTIEGYGFWDGLQTFRIRCAFPTPGTWHWETTCSPAADRGLHAQRGTVEVEPYRGRNPIYRHGFLRISDDRRHLAYADGTPFLWSGDTAWSTPYRATDPDWATYLADRVAKGFSLIQIATPPRWGTADFAQREPFADSTLAEWNPTFWQQVERKVQAANDAGLVIYYVGLMEPVLRYPPADKATLFARNLVARLFGNALIFSPSFDSRPNPLAHEVGRAVRDATAVHLISQHPGTGGGTPLPNFTLYFSDQPFIDFYSVQSGHNNGDRVRCARQSIDWVLHLYQLEPRRPVINVEAMYDGQGEKVWQAVDARSAGWRSWLSGSMGYTYGAGDVAPKVPEGHGGIWRWSDNPDHYDHWRKALQWESSTQMKYLRDFFAAFAWWQLAPAHDLIRNQPDDVTRRTVLATLPDRRRAVAYLPDNDAVEIDLTSFPGPISVRWFDPVRGTSTSTPDSVKSGAVHRFTPPRPGEWVLDLQHTP